MAMKKSGSSRPGGGINSRVNVSVPVRTGQKAEGISPRGVSQIGASIGNHSTDQGSNLSYKGEKWFDGKVPAGGAVKLGNEVAQATVCGVGGSRQVSKAGSQGQHGSANPGQSTPGANKPIFPGFK
jgi:hypothetical protein